MQQELNELYSQFEEDGLMADPIVLECFASMRRSIQDEDEKSVELVSLGLVEYSDGGRPPPFQADMLKGLELLEVGIRNMALELGGFAVVGFETQADDKAKELRAAVDAHSFEKHILKRNELESLLLAGSTELHSRSEAMEKSTRIAVLMLERGMNEKAMESLSRELESLLIRNNAIDDEHAMLRS